MLEKFLNKKVEIRTWGNNFAKGIVTKVDDNFIELDNKGMNIVVAIKSISIINSLQYRDKTRRINKKGEKRKWQ